jgi:hypothetical protein
MEEIEDYKIKYPMLVKEKQLIEERLREMML